MSVSSSLMKIWYFLIIVIFLSSLSLASAYEITNDSKNVQIYRDTPELVLIDGYVPEDIYELYPPILVTVTEPNGNIYTLKYPVTEERKYSFPILFDEFSMEGQYVIEISYRTNVFHTISILISKTTVPKTTIEPPILNESSKFFSSPKISTHSNTYSVQMNVLSFDNHDHVRLDVENRCAGISKIHSQDYRLTKIDFIVFEFEQLSLNKPNSCILIFSVFDTKLELIDFFFIDYNVNFKQDPIPEKIIRSTPKWIKSLVGYWIESKISDNTLTDAINYLVNTKIIQINNQKNYFIELDNYPNWFKQNSTLWKDGRISDEKFLIGLEVLSKK